MPAARCRNCIHFCWTLPPQLTDRDELSIFGRVIDPRSQAIAETVPLIWPCHFNNGRIKWPSTKERKKCAILNSETTAPLLVPAETYVLVKRFYAKEERRRIVAAVFYSSIPCGGMVGFENHLNYFMLKVAVSAGNWPRDFAHS